MENDIQFNMTDEELLKFTELFQKFDKTSITLRKEYFRLSRKVEELLEELEQKNDYLDEVYKKQQDSNRLLYTILDSLSSGVCVFNTDFMLVMANRKALSLLKKSEDDVSGLPYEEVFSFIEEEKTETLKEVQLSGMYDIEVERTLVVSGEDIPLYVKCSAIEGDDDELLGYVYSFDDLRKIKSLEENIRKNKNLWELGQMSAGIAHEIRNPLGGISGFATMLSRDLKDDEDKLELVNRIKDGVKSLNKITTDVLAYSRPISLKLDKLSVKSVIEECSELLKSDLSFSDIPFIIKHDFPDTDLKADVDYQIFRRIILNLLKNSVQACEPKGKIYITIKLRFNILKNFYTIEVIDKGIGIEKDKLSKLFTPFFTTKAEGTGLGLAMVKRMIEAMKGEIDVDSVFSEKTTFTLKIPIKIH